MGFEQLDPRSRFLHTTRKFFQTAIKRREATLVVTRKSQEISISDLSVANDREALHFLNLVQRYSV